MNKNVIFVSSVNQSFFEILHPHFISYCNKHNIDLIVNRTEKVKHTVRLPIKGMFERFQLYDLLEKYDRACYIDSDIYIKNNSPNIFDFVPTTKLGIYCESKDVNRDAFISHMKRNLKIDDNIPVYYNSGVLVASKIHKQIFKLDKLNKFFDKPNIVPGLWPDQDYLNYYIHKHDVNVYNIGYKFNFLKSEEALKNKENEAYFIHFAGIADRCNFIKNYIK